MARHINSDIDVLVNKISRLPGLGPRSARRIVLHLLRSREKTFSALISALQYVYDNVKRCPICGNMDVFDECCSICNDTSRNNETICIVESISDIWVIERSGCYNGKYHVLNGLLSSIDGYGPELLMLDKLAQRCQQHNVNEIIIALSTTLDGQTTDQYIRTYLQSIDGCKDIKVASLAVGMPVGGELDILDDGTLFTAFNFRK